MSSKRPSFIELHCEKLLVIVAGLALAFVTLQQLVFMGVGVKVGSETLSLNAVEERLRRKEADLSSKLDIDAPSPLVLPEPKRVSNEELFDGRKIAAVSPKTSLPPNQSALAKLLEGQAVSMSQWYFSPSFGASEVIGTLVTADAVAGAELPREFRTENPEFAAKYMSSATMDVTWSTPWAVIDLDAMRAELAMESMAQSPSLAAIPRPWISDSLFILDVVFERQELAGDGTWSEAVVVVPPVPGQGQDSWRAAVESESSNASTRDAVFNNLSRYEMQMDVLQPPLIPMTHGNFSPPSLNGSVTAIVVTPEEQMRDQAQRRIQAREKALSRTEDSLKAAGGELDPPAGSGTGGDSGDAAGDKDKPGGGFGMGGGGSMKKGASGADGAETQESKDRRIQLTRRVRVLRKELDGLRTVFEKRYPTPSESGSDSKPAIAESFAAKERVVAWTHDFDVRAGATYRYRTSVQIYNPFFTRKILLVADQQSLARGLAVRSATSSWGQEVAIPPATSFFVTNGSARDGVGGRRVSVELFRYANGQLKGSAEDLSPGDQVGGSKKSSAGNLDFSTPWFLVDIFEDAGTAGAGQQSGGVERWSIVAVFQRIDSDGMRIQSIRTIDGDKNSEKYKKFKSAAAANASASAAIPAAGGS